MDQIATSIGISSLAGNQPKSLIEWNAQYEAQSLRHDWWFKTGAAAIRAIRSAIKANITQPTAAPQLANA